MTTPRKSRSWIFLALGLFLVAALPVSFSPLARSAPMTGSVHDLTSNDGAPSDLCAQCHVPHYAGEIGLYQQDLTPNSAELTDNCYDCHDTNRVVLTSPGQPPAWASAAPDTGKLKDSLHDWDRTGEEQDIATMGGCSACHDIHLPDQSNPSYVGTYFTNARLWKRSLSFDIAEYYQKRDLKRTSGTPNNDGPNYLVGSTILCYDCHGGDARKAPAGDPFVPDDGDFDLANPPQDIAFSGDRQSTPGGTVGYYELPDGMEPDGPGDAPSLTAVRDSGAQPGGHYVKSKMANGGTEDNYGVLDPDDILLYKISIGDKLPCELCHDPHMGEINLINDDEVFFRRDIHAGENTIVIRSDTEFDGVTLKASPETRSGSGNGRLMCQYCHGTADWSHDYPNPATGIAPLITDNGTPKLTVYGIKINTTGSNNPTDGSSNAFPPPDGPPEHNSTDTTTPCTNCHKHNNINASCGGCHGFPPTTGAHAAHSGTVNGKPEFNCETCHGPNPGSASWHNQSGVSAYSSTDNFANITLMPSLSSTQRGAESAYYNTTWTRSGASFAPTVTKAAGYQFTCTNVYCHGMDTVNWTWSGDESSVGGTSSEGGYRLCGGCHGMAADIDGDGDLDPQRTGVIDVASFRSRQGTLYQASNAAANYLKPVSCYSRGGHGDTNIYNESPYIESAPNSGLPVACGSCHDATTPHLSGITSNPYRIKTSYPGASGQETAVTNLCTQTNCHPKAISGSDYAVLEKPTDTNQAAHRHPMDYWPLYGGTPTTYYVSVSNKYVVRSGSSSTSDPKYDPVGVTPSVTTHIDRYVDHWAWWNASKQATSGTTGDDLPFIPLGNSLAKGSGEAFDNTTDSTDGLATCTACHNPHGTDLYVPGEDPDSSCASTLQAIPDNNMLRLRVDDGGGELCDACHLP